MGILEPPRKTHRGNMPLWSKKSPIFFLEITASPSVRRRAGFLLPVDLVIFPGGLWLSRIRTLQYLQIKSVFLDP